MDGLRLVGLLQNVPGNFRGLVGGDRMFLDNRIRPV